MNKARLRKEYLEKRLALSSEEKKRAEESVSRRFFDLLDVSGVRLLHHYVPMSSKAEFDPRLILEYATRLHPGIRFAVRGRSKRGRLASSTLPRTCSQR